MFTDIAATQPGDATLSGDGEPEQVPARKVTGNFWSVLGVQPLLGRVFTEDEDDEACASSSSATDCGSGASAASPDVVGRKITLNDKPYEVIGVMPREFYFMPARDIDIWMPASFPPWMRTELRVARRALRRAAQARRHAGAGQGIDGGIEPAGDGEGLPRPAFGDRDAAAGRAGGQDANGADRAAGASAALLLIACVNLANLLLSRGAVRGREVAVRAALGAGRGRLIAQFLTESLVLAGLGALAGLALAVPAMRFLERLVPETMGAVRLTLDWRVLAFSAAVAIAAALTFGLAPALRGSRLARRTGCATADAAPPARAATGSSIRSSSSRRRSPSCC